MGRDAGCRVERDRLHILHGVYPEFPAALALALTLLVVTRARPLRPADGLLLTILLSAMCWLVAKCALLALPVSAYFLLKTDWPGRPALVVSGAASAVFFAWFHLDLFGGLTPTEQM